MATNEPSEQEIGEREERETLDRVNASNDVVQFGNTISHNNMTSRYAEIALSDAVKFQSQMNAEHLRAVQQEREHADAREKQTMSHENTSREHASENNRYTLDRLYSVFPEEAVGLRTLIEGIVKEAVKETK